MHNTTLISSKMFSSYDVTREPVNVVMSGTGVLIYNKNLIF